MKPLVFSLVYNRKEDAINHFKSIKKMAGNRNGFYWLVVDNGSRDGLENWLEEHRTDFDSIIHLPFNHGIVHGINRGFAERELGQTVIKFDGDTILDKRCKPFIKHIKALEYQMERWIELNPDKRPGLIGGQWAGSNAEVERLRVLSMGAIFMFYAEVLTENAYPIIGYADEASVSDDCEFFERCKYGKITNFVSSAIQFIKPSTDLSAKSSYKSIRNRNLHRLASMGVHGVRAASWEQAKLGNTFRSSIWKSETLKQYNPVITSTSDNFYKSESKTYEEWSKSHVEWFKENAQEKLS